MTIKDIAAECGCAVGTVSRVLNNQTYVSEKTRKKVLEVVDKYGFVLNKNARELKARGSKAFVIIVKGVANVLLDSLLEIVQRKIEQLPYDSSVFVLDEYDNESKIAWNIYCEKKPLGFIFLGGNPESQEEFHRLQDLNIPCVLISSRSLDKEILNLSSVSTDNVAACMELGRYVAKKGHKKVGIIGGDYQRSRMTRRRYKGFVDGLAECGVEFDFDKAYEGDKYTLEGGYYGCEKLLKKFPDVTAIFCMSDIMAIGCCRRLKDEGRSVPDDVSVVGFDGLPISQFYLPRLTTIKQLEWELCTKGIEVLVDMVENKTTSQHILVPFEFIEGESVKNVE